MQRWNSFTSVSYTHLDVYKRQVLRRILNYAGTLGIFVDSKVLDIRVKQTQKSLPILSLPEQMILPVSYTHLDVYKRQGYNTFGGNWGFAVGALNAGMQILGGLSAIYTLGSGLSLIHI